ncbi:MAG TPA: TadE family protein [Candidatus Elarobacter sp.]|jgi:hypothetical protein
MNGLSRGTALVETTLALGIVLMVLFGTLQFGLLGFTQAAQDGAAFVAARTYALNPAGGTASAASSASSVFDAVAPSAIAVAPNASAGTVTASVTSTQSGVSVPGAPSSVTLRSRATERIPAAASAAAGAFGALATLTNYRDASGIAHAGYTIGLAQTFNAGHGKNGRFAEWYCRAGVYSGLSFPSKRPTGSSAGRGSAWDPTDCNSFLSAIYDWDSGSTCA